MMLHSCTKNNDTNPTTAKDINTATKVSVDRFSSTAGHLMVRTTTNGLPAANEAINFDNAPFITLGLDRLGMPAWYYNFDIQSTMPDDIYVFFKAGSNSPVPGQNNVIPSIPGDAGYNDFWIVNKVTVPDNYTANSLTSEAEILASGYTITKTNMIVNCPVVPFNSKANRSKTANTPSALTLGWYKNQAVAYFSFEEAALTATAGLVPTSPIYVLFNDNNSGPASGFKTETNNPLQTHNVLETIPSDVSYSPLWDVRVIDNTHFNAISNLNTAKSFNHNKAGATVNCPIVK